MKITNIEAIHLRLPEIVEAADGTQDCLIVRVHTDAGITGLGEVVSCSYVAKAVIEAPRSAPFRHGLSAIVTGMDALDFDAIHNAMIEGVSWYGPGGVARQAMSGIDMALWDIWGKAEDKPVRQFIASRCGRCSARLCERPVARVSGIGTRIRERVFGAGLSVGKIRLGTNGTRRRFRRGIGRSGARGFGARCKFDGGCWSRVGCGNRVEPRGAI